MGALRKGITAVGVAALAALALPAGAAACRQSLSVTSAPRPVMPGNSFNFTVTAKDPTDASTRPTPASSTSAAATAIPPCPANQP